MMRITINLMDQGGKYLICLCVYFCVCVVTWAFIGYSTDMGAGMGCLVGIMFTIMSIIAAIFTGLFLRVTATVCERYKNRLRYGTVSEDGGPVDNA